MAGAASLHRDREVVSQSELGKIASGYAKPPSSSNNPNMGNFQRHQGAKVSLNAPEALTIPSSR